MVSTALAFDTGHHFDLTQEVFAEQGFNQNAIDVAKVENWLVDYYSSQPAAGLKQELEHLHFDNLFTDQQVKSYWDNLTANTRTAIQNAARTNDSLKIIAITGMSLHVLQDFYTHSNWVNLYPAQAQTYNTNTWFSGELKSGVFTGRYNKPGFQPEHGGYDSGLNHDSYNRPDWDQSYVVAYVASREWLNQIRLWVEEINPQVWSTARTLSLTPSIRQKLDNDLEAAYRISEWIYIGKEDGHWKGKGSGSKADLVPFIAKWTASSDSIFVDHFKKDRWFTELNPGLGEPSSSPANVPNVKPLPVNKQAIIVRTISVEEDTVGFLEPKVDTAGEADFYAKITVDGQSFIESAQIDQKAIQPDWTTIKFIDRNRASIPIRYELWDEDGGIRGGDDRIDINPNTGYFLNFFLDTRSTALSGEVQGVHNTAETAVRTTGNEKDRAKLQYFVTARPLNGGQTSNGVNTGTDQLLQNATLQNLLKIIKPLLA